MKRVAMLRMFLLTPVLALPGFAAELDFFQLIKTKNDKGDFLKAEGKELDVANADITINVPNLCSCRSACLVYHECKAVSAVQVSSTDTTYKCYLSNDYPHDSTFVDNPLATYLFWKASVPSLFHKIMPDNLMYLVPERSHHFHDAYDYCNRIPGYRLARLKTIEQYHSGLEIHQQLGERLWVDLRIDPAAHVYWGDGTPFSLGVSVSHRAKTYVKYFRFQNNILDDTENGNDYKFLCQANPSGEGF